MKIDKVEGTDVIQVTTEKGESKLVTVDELKKFMVSDEFLNHIEKLGNRVNGLETKKSAPKKIEAKK